MKFFFIAMVLFGLVMVLLSRIRFKESWAMKAINQFMKNTEPVTEEDKESFRTIFSIYLEDKYRSVIVFDVTGNDEFIRGMDLVVRDSTIDNLKSNIAEYIYTWEK